MSILRTLIISTYLFTKEGQSKRKFYFLIIIFTILYKDQNIIDEIIIVTSQKMFCVHNPLEARVII